MNTHDDFEEFLRLLVAAGVEFVLVGGYAVAFHGYVRTTQDIDIFFRPAKANVERVCEALRRFGIGDEMFRPEDVAEPGAILRVGVPPTRIELLNEISGCTFDEVWQRREPGTYGSVSVSFISRQDLLRNKAAAGRPKDLADIDELGG